MWTLEWLKGYVDNNINFDCSLYSRLQNWQGKDSNHFEEMVILRTFKDW